MKTVDVNPNVSKDIATILRIGMIIEKSKNSSVGHELSGNIQIPGFPLDGRSDGGISLQLDPKRSLYSEYSDGIHIVATSGQKKVSFSGKLKDGVITIDFDTLVITNGRREAHITNGSTTSGSAYVYLQKTAR